ncbi:LOB domain-containing protein 11-like [Cryptomeria japonica]|uniref:LOB domain-containing protein 11-like n=1 Tax=Cryptomeria japonica TaxID=3369 RepID=UPI0027D9D151|nr:LOB domain-containing protein 11-like [Cryptomeria japonica]
MDPNSHLNQMARTVYPCAACKFQRRKCGDKCVLAPYFPPSDPDKFLVVHKLFRTRNIVKILQIEITTQILFQHHLFFVKDIPAEKREDAVTSLVYEAGTRVNDPIYGCTGAICRLQKQVLKIQSELAASKVELLNTQNNLASLVTSFCNAGRAKTTLGVVHQSDPHNKDDLKVLQDIEEPFGLWAPL